MKIWITFNSVRSLQSGGLDRCRVWWQKPNYVFVEKEKDYDDLPFGGANTVYHGLEQLGWRYARTEGLETSSVSLGRIFNFEGDVCFHVWEELCKFFKSKDLRKWDDMKKKHNLHAKDFLLELNIDFTMTPKE